MLFSCTVFAQEKTPCFKAYNSKGVEINTFCVDQEINFQDCGNVVKDEEEYYAFDYKSGSPIPSDLTTTKKHTYTKPGIYRVLHIGNYGGTTLTDTVSRVFEVKAAPNPEFTVTACANNTITINITDTHYDEYLIDFGDGNLPNTVKPGTEFQYKYSNSNRYAITVMGVFKSTSCNNLSQKEVTLLPSPPTPKIQDLTVLQQSASGEIQMGLQQLHSDYSYIIEASVNGAAFSSVATIENNSQSSLDYTLTGINTETVSRYRIRPQDACGTAITNYSNVISNISLAVVPGDEEVSLSWSTAPNTFKEFEVYRDGTLIKILPNTVFNYSDSGLSCGQTPSYTLKGITESGSTSTSVTQRVQITSTLKPPAPYLFSSFNTDNQVVLSLKLPDDKQAREIELEKSTNGAAYKSLASLQQPSYTDVIPEVSNFCYRASFTDLCGNTSAISNVSCPIILQAEKQEGGAVQLNWTAYSGFPNGVKQYHVELLDGNGSVVNNYPVNGTSFLDQTLSDNLQLLRYRIRANSGSGVETTYSNIEQVEQDVQLHVPSAFSPNSDGLNDTFVVKGKLFSNFSIKIYNNLGNVVYQSTDAEAGWDGTFKGEMMPVGAYAYEITVKTSFGATKQRTGTVTLLR